MHHVEEEVNGKRMGDRYLDRMTLKVGWLEFNVSFQHKYGYIRDENDLDSWSRLESREVKVNGVKVNNHGKYEGQRSFHATVIVGTHSHSRLIASHDQFLNGGQLLGTVHTSTTFPDISWITVGGWRWALVSPDGVAPSRMVGVSASVNPPLHHKVLKFSLNDL